MLFNSIEFAIFLPIVFFLYWFVTNKSIKLQNLLLLVSSLIFYGWWDWRFLFLIIFSSIVDFLVGIGLSKTDKKSTRQQLLSISIIINLGLLGFFKYFNFFVESFASAFTLFGEHLEVSRLNIILPVGISFYTFQTMSYSIDVYRRKLLPTTDIVAFSAYVSFFPQLVAGPIERATNLLPQFFIKRTFEYYKAADGMRQILWGLFKKMVIADNCAYYANEIFNNYSDYSGSALFFGAIFFTFQIYCDFSGYSDIAIGTARLFGFDLMKNFAFPYFSRDIAEFWRRWHISLSTWFRDYLYIPLGGSKVKTSEKIRNTFIVFLVSGLWHGANWTFLAWGFLNALYFLPLLLLKLNRRYTNNVAEGHFLPTLKEAVQVGTTFFITVIAWVFFRSETIGMAFEYLYILFSASLFHPPGLAFGELFTLFLIFIFVLFEWTQRENDHALQFSHRSTSRGLRWSIYVAVGIAILALGGIQQAFIYFQF